MEQATPSVTQGWRRHWRDLNVFVGAFAAFVSLGGFAVFVPLSIVLKLVFPSRAAELLAWPLGYALVTAFLSWRWWKHGLSPRQIDPARHTRFRVGHGLLAACNLSVLLTYVGATFGFYSLLPGISAVVGLFVALMSLASMGLLLGLVLVFSARGTAPAFADTASAAAGARFTPSAKWPPEPTVAGRPPSAIFVLAGLMVSSLVLYMAGIYAWIGFSSRQATFSNIVLPIAIGVYAVYVMTAVGLLIKRIRHANWVAWTPATLFLLVAPAVQAFGMLFRDSSGDAAGSCEWVCVLRVNGRST